MRGTVGFSLLVAWLLSTALAGCGTPSPPLEPSPQPGAGLTKGQAATKGATLAEGPAPTERPAPTKDATLREGPATSVGTASAPAPVTTPVTGPVTAPVAGPRLSRPPPEVVRAMLELASVARGEPVHVLGCGDGAIPVGAARDRGARIIAIDPSSEAITRARENVRLAAVDSLVEFRQEDVVDAKIGDAQVLLVYLPRSLNKKIEHRLQKDLKPGTRVVSWVPTITDLGVDNEESGTIYVYKVPARSHPESLAPYVQTPMQVVHRMLDMAKVTKDDVVYDLGCGDGRIVVEAAKRYGARAVGIDFDTRRIQEAQERAQREGVEQLVEFRHENFMTADISDATVVTLFLLPESNKVLKPKLAALRPGARIVSHQFDTEGWPPTQKETLTLPGGEQHRIYLWEVRQDRIGGEGEPAR